jgi:hypothetical protein
MGEEDFKSANPTACLYPDNQPMNRVAVAAQ